MTSPVINTDFTNANVNGKTKQVLIIATPSKKSPTSISGGMNCDKRSRSAELTKQETNAINNKGSIYNQTK